MRLKFFYVIICLGIFLNVQAQKKVKVHTVAFYNLENLFDTKKDPIKFDEEYTPAKGWTKESYTKKIDNLARVISELGISDVQKNTPVVIGVCEVENRDVLEDLVKHPKLIDLGYNIVHFDSPDARGIDVGLLYQVKYFTPTSFANIPLYLYKDMLKGKKKEDSEDEDDSNENGTSNRKYTRDQLLVTGVLDGEEINFIVNHWPSRSGGEKRSSPFREAAGKLNRKIIDSLYKINPDAKIITMGDFNDDPINKSIKKEIGTVAYRDDIRKKGMYNPMEKLYKNGEGTLGYRDAWNLFDQIIVSEPLVRKEYSTWTYWKVSRFVKPYLIQNEGRWKGYPKRNSNGIPGYSDHFPVYIYLVKEVY